VHARRQERTLLATKTFTLTVGNTLHPSSRHRKFRANIDAQQKVKESKKMMDVEGSDTRREEEV
jgi:hypothetical protein